MTILRIFRDGSWQAIGVFITIILAALGLVYNEFIKPHYEIQAVVLATTSLVEINEEFLKDIKIEFKGQLVNNLSLLQVKLENLGNQPVRRDDYDQPISFIFPKEATVIESTILESLPENIKIPLNIQKNVVTLEPTLLNPADKIILRFLFVNAPPVGQSLPFVIDARIANINKIEVITALEQNNSSTLWGARLGTISVLTGMLTAILLVASFWARISSRERLLIVLLLLILLIMLVVLISR